MSKETLEELKAIDSNQPKDGTAQIYNGEYWKQTKNLTFYVWSNVRGFYEWVPDAPKDLCSLRSMSDIKRIIELTEDKMRLDHLQKCNEIFNERAGSNYGWKVDCNHNRIAIVDTGLKGVSIRNAIDDHIKRTPNL